jgi:exodeoxyribonuclease VII small subunit
MTKKKLTYSEAVEEIEEILSKIENEELDVDELSDQVKRVSYLIKLCKEKLFKTQHEVEQILDEIDDIDEE